MLGPPRRDLLEYGAPADLGKRRRGVGPGPLAIEIGRYSLRREIPSTNEYGGACFYAVAVGSQFEVAVFVRRFPEAHMTEAMNETLRRRALTRWHATESIFDLAVQDGSVLAITEFIEGLSIAELRAALDARGERLPWSVALAMTSDVIDRVDELRDANVPLPAITPARLRISYWARIYACVSAPEIADVSWHRRLVDMVVPVLALAATADERALIDRLALDDNPAALSVIADALVDRHPELAPALPALLDPSLELERSGRQILEESIDTAALAAFWELFLALRATA